MAISFVYSSSSAAAAAAVEMIYAVLDCVMEEVLMIPVFVDDFVEFDYLYDVDDSDDAAMAILVQAADEQHNAKVTILSLGHQLTLPRQYNNDHPQ